METTKRIYCDGAVEAFVSEFTSDTGIAEYHILITVSDPGLPFVRQLECVSAAYAEICGSGPAAGAVAVFRRYFMSDSANQAEAVKGNDPGGCAVSFVEQAPLNGTKIAMWAWLQGGVEAGLCPDGIMRAEHDGYVQYWTGSAVHKAEYSATQTLMLLDDYVGQLAAHGCTLADNCIRTWFFVQNVDVNYAGVVQGRKELFATQGLTDKTHYIASTGIEGRHADPGILVQLDTYAVKGLRPGQIQFLYAPTHLNPTYEYGVTFERGTAISYGDRRHVFISGTASIDNRGEIVHPGDVLKQTERMLENISVLLAEAGAAMDDIAQAIVYLRDPADYSVVRRYLDSRYPWLPCVIVHAPVCRPGWLIETECIAVVPVKTCFGPL